MNELKLVSVVIPCYNAEKWIDKCIDSVLKQDYPNIEIIVVDDSSTDKSASIITSYKVKLIKNESNLGECRTSDIGFGAATGEYVCRLSADDEFVYPDHISRQVIEMNGHSLDWCYNSKNRIGPSIEDSIVVQTTWASIPIRYASWVLCVFDNLFLNFPMVCYLLVGFRNPINVSALMFRTDSYRKYLSWDNNGLTSVCDTRLLANIFLHRLKGRAIRKIGSLYRIHEDQATGKPETNKNLTLVMRAIYEETLKPYYPFWVRFCSGFILNRI